MTPEERDAAARAARTARRNRLRTSAGEIQERDFRPDRHDHQGEKNDFSFELKD